MKLSPARVPETRGRPQPAMPISATDSKTILSLLSVPPAAPCPPHFPHPDNRAILPLIASPRISHISIATPTKTTRPLVVVPCSVPAYLPVKFSFASSQFGQSD